jgi:phage gp16-like protein
MAEKKEYIVIKKNTRNYELGETISLTDTEAATLVNKVRPKDEVEKQTAAGRKSNAEKRVIELEGDLASLQAILKQVVEANPQIQPVVQQLVTAAATAKAEANKPAE